MRLKMDLHSAEELTAAAAFCTALAAARKTHEGFADQVMRGLSRATYAPWVKQTADPTGAEPEADGVTAGEIVDSQEALTPAPAEPPKKRGRPRKEQPAEPLTVASYVEIPDDITGQEIAEKFAGLRDGQIDIEDAIASQADEQETAQDAPDEPNVHETAPAPADPAAGWTLQDARVFGKALLDRAPDVETGNRRLAAVLAPFGVQRVRDLPVDQIEAFVIATTKEVF